MLKRTDILAGDFFVAVKRRRRLREWSWEIQRRYKPLGVRLDGDGFKSEFAAKLAGGRPCPRGKSLSAGRNADRACSRHPLLARPPSPSRLPYSKADAANKTCG